MAPVSSPVCNHLYASTSWKTALSLDFSSITLCDPNTGEEPGNEVARLLTTIRFVIFYIQYRETFTQLDINILVGIHCFLFQHCPTFQLQCTLPKYLLECVQCMCLEWCIMYPAWLSAAYIESMCPQVFTITIIRFLIPYILIKNWWTGKEARLRLGKHNVSVICNRRIFWVCNH